MSGRQLVVDDGAGADDETELPSRADAEVIPHSPFASQPSRFGSLGNILRRKSAVGSVSVSVLDDVPFPGVKLHDDLPDALPLPLPRAAPSRPPQYPSASHLASPSLPSSPSFSFSSSSSSSSSTSASTTSSSVSIAIPAPAPASASASSLPAPFSSLSDLDSSSAANSTHLYSMSLHSPSSSALARAPSPLPSFPPASLAPSRSFDSQAPSRAVDPQPPPSSHERSARPTLASSHRTQHAAPTRPPPLPPASLSPPPDHPSAPAPAAHPNANPISSPPGLSASLPNLDTEPVPRTAGFSIGSNRRASPSQAADPSPTSPRPDLPSPSPSATPPSSIPSRPVLPEPPPRASPPPSSDSAAAEPPPSLLDGPSLTPPFPGIALKVVDHTSLSSSVTASSSAPLLPYASLPPSSAVAPSASSPASPHANLPPTATTASFPSLPSSLSSPLPSSAPGPASVSFPSLPSAARQPSAELAAKRSTRKSAAPSSFASASKSLAELLKPAKRAHLQFGLKGGIMRRWFEDPDASLQAQKQEPSPAALLECFDRLLALRPRLGFWSHVNDDAESVPGLSAGRGFEDLFFINAPREDELAAAMERFLDEAELLIPEAVLFAQLKASSPSFPSPAFEAERELFFIRATVPHWISPFRRRILAASQLIDHASLAFVHKAVKLYVRKTEARAASPSKPSHHRLRLARGFLYYLQTHRHDCGNFLLGLPVAPAWVPALFRQGATAKAAPEDELLRERVAELAQQSDAEALRAKLAQLYHHFCASGDTLFAAGDLVVYQHPSSDYVFGRVISISNPPSSSTSISSTSTSTSSTSSISSSTSTISTTSQQQIFISVDPLENSSTAVSKSSLRKLTPTMLSLMGSLDGLFKLLQDPVLGFFQKISGHVSHKLRYFLWENGLDPEVFFDKPKTLPPRFADGWHLTRWQQYVATIAALSASGEVEQLFEELEYQHLTHAQQFSRSISGVRLLPFQSDAFLDNLAESSTKPASPEQSYLRALWKTVTYEAYRWLEQLHAAAKQIVEGSCKEQLTDWWLSLIDRRVSDFLQERGFDVHALPEDYIRDAPPDLELVKKNLQIVRAVLDPLGAERQRVRRFVGDLKAVIYQAIDAFVAENKALIQQTLNVSYPLFSDPEWQGLVKKLAEVPSPAGTPLPAATVAWISDFVDDHAYVEEMKRMETEEFDPACSDQKLRLSAVVPISGLIIGKFSIIENELMTALQNWDYTDEAMPDARCAPEPAAAGEGPVGFTFSGPDELDTTNEPAPHVTRIISSRIVS